MMGKCEDCALDKILNVDVYMVRKTQNFASGIEKTKR